MKKNKNSRKQIKSKWITIFIIGIVLTFGFLALIVFYTSYGEKAVEEKDRKRFESAANSVMELSQKFQVAELNGGNWSYEKYCNIQEVKFKDYINCNVVTSSRYTVSSPQHGTDLVDKHNKILHSDLAFSKTQDTLSRKEYPLFEELFSKQASTEADKLANPLYIHKETNLMCSMNYKVGELSNVSNLSMDVSFSCGGSAQKSWYNK